MEKGPESRKHEVKLRPPLCRPLKYSMMYNTSRKSEEYIMGMQHDEKSFYIDLALAENLVILMKIAMIHELTGEEEKQPLLRDIV